MKNDKAMRLLALAQEKANEVVGLVSEALSIVEGSTTAAKEEVKQEQPKTAREFLAEIRASETPNEQRKEVIEKAKKFVKDVQEKEHDEVKTIDGEFYGVYFGETDRLKYVINENKRTVVALIIGVISDCVYHRGIAKCNPSDVFNADIGKAIALGRALGLDVSEFEKAVQPTELVVGMVVLGDRDYYKNKKLTLKELPDEHKNEINAFGYEETKRDDYVYKSQIGKITNDTNAQY